MKITPFRPLLANPQLAPKLSSPPYDTISRSEARTLLSSGGNLFLNVIRADAALPDSVDEHSPEVYTQAATALKKMEEDGLLLREASPSLYLYRLEWRGKTQTGITALVPLSELDNNTVKPHERTRPEKENDRIAHMVATEAQCEAVFLTFRGNEKIKSLLTPTTPPLLSFTSSDGVTHSLYRAERTTEIVAAFAELPAAYIADGHHRCAAAQKARAKLNAPLGEYLLSVLFSSDEVNILPYYRLVRGNEEQLKFLVNKLTLTPCDGGDCTSRGEFRLYANGRWSAFRLSGADFDATLLQEQIIAPYFGIADPRTDERISFVGGIRGTVALERAVNAGEALCAFSLYPVMVDDLLKLSDDGGIMPPKSTWFEPKLRSGLFLSPFRAQNDLRKEI